MQGKRHVGEEAQERRGTQGKGHVRDKPCSMGNKVVENNLSMVFERRD